MRKNKTFQRQTTQTHGLIKALKFQILEKFYSREFKVSLRTVAFEKTGVETLAEMDFQNQPMRAKLDANIQIENGKVLDLYLDLSNVSVLDTET